ncbi:MAG TPA: hypothetical protein VF702_06945 [Allosphingosinicella sp.]|jgi:type IV secretory pathway VirB2 component (pilin)
MSSKKFVSAFAAFALMAAPTMAAAQTQAPLAPAEESLEGSSLRDGDDGGVGQILPIIAIIAIVFLIRELVKDRNLGEQDPRSP